MVRCRRRCAPKLKALLVASVTCAAILLMTRGPSQDSDFNATAVENSDVMNTGSNSLTEPEVPMPGRFVTAASDSHREQLTTTVVSDSWHPVVMNALRRVESQARAALVDIGAKLPYAQNGGFTATTAKSNPRERNSSRNDINHKPVMSWKNVDSGSLRTLDNIWNNVDKRTDIFDPKVFNTSYVLTVIDNSSRSLAESLMKRLPKCKSYLMEMFRAKEVVPFVVKPRGGVGISKPLCLVTTITDTRLHQLKDLLVSWRGCITLVLYLEKDRNQMIVELLKMWIPSLHDQITIHFVYSAGSVLTPINFLRNLALVMTTADYVMYIDIDLIPSPGLYDKLVSYIERNTYGIADNTALIIPAFAINKRDVSPPRDKSQMKSLVLNGEASPFYIKEYRPAYGPTDYTRWIKTTEAYTVSVGCYKEFEPYMLIRNNGILYSEVFVHRFVNKVIMFTELCIRMYEFVVEPEGFLTHRPHGHEGVAHLVLSYYNVKTCAYTSYKLHRVRSNLHSNSSAIL